VGEKGDLNNENPSLEKRKLKKPVARKQKRLNQDLVLGLLKRHTNISIFIKRCMKIIINYK
jgi:hypothetical protein